MKDEGVLGEGGNKVRKLEFILPELERRGVRTVVSAGGLGTNWGLALARHAAERGIATELALVEQPRTPEVEERLEQLRAVARVHLTHDNRRTALALPRIMGRAAVRDRAAAGVAAAGRVVADRHPRLRRRRAWSWARRWRPASCPSPRGWSPRWDRAAPPRAWRSA